MYIKDIRANGCTRVLSNDRFSITALTGALPIGYVFSLDLSQEVPVLFYQTDSIIDIGTNITFDPLQFPYLFSFGVYVLNGLNQSVCA